MLRLYSLPLMGMLLTSSGVAQDRDEHRWENVESLRKGQKLEVTTTGLRTVQGTYLDSSEAAIRLQSSEGEVTLMKEEVFRVKSQEGKRKQNITRRSRRWSSGRRCPGCCCRLQGRRGWLRSGKQQRQTRGQRGRCRYWGRDRVAVRWASCHLPCKVPATTLAVANADRVTSTESKPFLTSMLHVRLPDIALSLYSILVGNWRQTLKSKFVR